MHNTQVPFVVANAYFLLALFLMPRTIGLLGAIVLGILWFVVWWVATPVKKTIDGRYVLDQ